jgi:hypothetical protein
LELGSLGGPALSCCLLCLGPGCRCHILDLPVGHRRQAGEHIAQISLRVDASAAASFDDGEQDGTALAGFSLADEEPIFLADGAGTNGVLNKVVVYASTGRWGSPGSNPGWLFRSRQKHWERFKR